MNYKKRAFVAMSDDELKTLKKTLNYVKRLKIFKELEKCKEENKTEVKKVA